MQYGLFLPNFGPFGDALVIAELARDAERHGWDGLFIWDHILFQEDPPADVVDPWVALTAVALATNRLRFGALMTPLARRRPWKVARESASLDRLSNGRLIFGAGLGFPPQAEFELFGEESDDRVRAQKLDEGLAVLTGLWTGEPFSFEGSHFSIGRTTFLPPPVQEPHPPIWIAGWWPHKPPLRRAARWDGVFPELVGGDLPSPEQLAELLQYVKRHRERSDPFDVVLNGYSPDDPEEGRLFLEPYREQGLTWWLERVDPGRLYDVDETKRRIQRGPPAA